MNLSAELVSQFVKATKDDVNESTTATVYGTTVLYDGRTYVRLDGSDLLTPVTTTTNVDDGERVVVTIDKHEAIITGNITAPAARVDDVEEVSRQVTVVEGLVADKVSTSQLEAESARIDTLVADNVYIKEKLVANEAEIDKLVANNVTINGRLDAQEAYIEKLDTEKLSADTAVITYATIENLEATNLNVRNLSATFGEFEQLTTDSFKAIDANINKLTAEKADIEDLNATNARIDNLDATYARIEDLEATNINVGNLEADVAEIDTLIFGSATGTSIQTSFANAVIAQLGNAQIKSAMIDSLSASKITAGDIVTNNVRVVSDDGRLLISDETIQISDENRVRVQIGKDAANDYSINIWDEDGNLMFSKGGITDSAIKEAIIRNDMVASDANIAANKLDISSLFTEINGSTETINAGRVYIDAEKQTLDVSFTQMSSDVSDLSNDVSTQGTQISTIQGQISSKIWEQDIKTATDPLGASIDTLNTKHSTLEQTVNGISATVGEHTSQIATKADGSTVTEVNNRVTAVELDLSGFKSTVSETYATQSSLTEAEGEIESISNKQSSLEQTVNGISATVSQHTTQIANKADGSTVTEIGNRVSKVETDLSGFKSTVSDTYATKTELGEAEGEIDTLNKNYSTLNQTVNGISATVGQHTTQIATKADSSTVTEVNNRVTNVETSLDGFKTTVSNTYITKVEDASKGEQLIVNSNGLMGDNTNFSSWTFDGAVAYNTPGSFSRSSKGVVATDEYFLINPQNEYTISFDAKSLLGKGTLYSMLMFYDADKNEIAAANHMHRAESTTTLARALNTGDTVIYLSDISGWSTSYAYGFYMMIWNYTNSFGYTYPSGTYTRNRIVLPKTSSNLLDSSRINTTNKTITLASAYTGPTIPAGTYVSQGGDGSTYKYCGCINQVISSEWTHYYGKYSGVDNSGLNIGTAYPPGTAYSKVGFLWNYNNTAGENIWITNVCVTETTAISAIEDGLNETNENLSNITETVSDLSIESNKIKASVEDVTKTVNDITGEVETLNSNVTSLTQTSTDLTIDVKNIYDNGVTKVETTTGFTFNEDGMTVDGTDSPTKTQITTDGMNVYKKNADSTTEVVLEATSEGVEATDLHAKTYLIVGGRSRFENYGSNRTGCFWIGG